MPTDPLAYAVRPPRATDAEALGALHCRVWQETYAGLMAPESLARLRPERFADSWSLRLERMDPGGLHPDGEVVMLATLAQDPVGFVSVGPARDENPPTVLQLWALNVLPEHQGTGLADRLMADSLGEAPAYLWVARGNERATRFYRRHGFVLDGEQSQERPDGITELRMVRA